VQGAGPTGPRRFRRRRARSTPAYTHARTIDEYRVCLEKLALDAHEHYADAVWLPAWRFDDAINQVDANGHPYDTLYDAGNVWSVQYKQVVVYTMMRACRARIPRAAISS
jgi:hypothetical protein